MTKRKYLVENFKRKSFYTIEEISQKTRAAKRTIVENWKKEGLKIVQGRVKKEEIQRFLSQKRKSKKKQSISINEIFCLKTKQVVKMQASKKYELRFFSINKKFYLSCDCFGCVCSNLSCVNRFSGAKTRLSKIISSKLALGIYETKPIFVDLSLLNDDAFAHLEFLKQKGDVNGNK